MSISTIKRQVKNVAYNFSDAQVKVREATSNDPWGPTTALMSEIADMTNNPSAFTEIMSMLWKRLNDHGKNWRHVYKSLVLLDYLIKCGSDKVAAQCRENIYSIETLKDFQHIEENRDQGLNVREKAKQMVILLNDEERLKSERTRFQMTRKRFITNGTGISSDGTSRSTRRGDTFVCDSELEEARPSSIGEEEMQLQIALALSREESAKEEDLRRGDDVRLQIALEESKRNEKAANNGSDVFGATDAFGASSGFGFQPAETLPAPAKKVEKSGLESVLEDLMELNLSTVAPTSTNAPTLNDPWGAPIGLNDPWSVTPVTPIIAPPKPKNAGTHDIYPNLMGPVPTAATNDPWATPATTSSSSGFVSTTASNDPWSALSSNITTEPSAPVNDPWAFAFSTKPKNVGG